MPFLSLFLWLLLLWSLAPLCFPLARRLWALSPILGTREGDSSWPDRGWAGGGWPDGGWPDGGWAAGRVLALTLWTLAAFWAGHLHLPVRLGWVLLLPAAAFSLWSWKRHWKELSAELRARARAIVLVDGVLLLAFGAFLLLRCLWPDIDNGEKPMDMALASACARANFLPPPNPYLAGVRLGGYYYLGHLQAALLTDAVGTSLRWSYNFACATLPALSASLAFPLAAFLCRSWKRGGFATLIILVAGTLEPLRQWYEPNEVGARAWPLSPWNMRSLDYFSTSRVIPNPIHGSSGVNYTINEYPFFTETYGDLHAHFFAQPIALLLISLAISLFFNRRPLDPLKQLTLTRVLLVGGVLAALMVTNTWDVPAYWLLAALCLFAPCRARGSEEPGEPVRAQVLDRTLSKSARRRQRRAQLEGKRSEPGAQGQSGAQVLEERDEEQAAEGPCLSGRVLSGLLILMTIVVLVLAVPYVRNLHTNAFPPTPLDLPATPPLSWLLMWGPFAVAWCLALGRAWREDGRFRFHPAWLLAPLSLWLVLKLVPAGSVSFNWIRHAPPDSLLPYKFAYAWGADEGGADAPVPLALVRRLVLPLAGGADYFAPIALATLLILSLRGALRSQQPRFALLCRLAVCGLVPLLWSELTWAGFLDRSLEGMTFHRQDTVFKFGLQGWFLLGLASVCAALGPWAGHRRDEEGKEPKREQGAWRAWPLPVQAAFGAALSVMFTCSILCVWGRGLIKSAESMGQMSEDPRPWPLKFISTIHAPDAWAHLAEPEKDAAAWLSARAHDGDSLMEADQQPNGDSDYTPFIRYAHVTGIPTVVGPSSHTFQWGSGKLDAHDVGDLVSKRKAQVHAFYKSNGQMMRDPNWRASQKRDLGLRFIILGELERQEYGAASVDAAIAAAPSTQAFGEPGDSHRVVVVDLG